MPIQQIVTTIDSDQCNWKKYINTIEGMFKFRALPDFRSYDEIRYLKMNRAEYKYDVSTGYHKYVSFAFRTTGFQLSDHAPLKQNGIFTWNLLHHYSYNGSNDYIDKSILRHFHYPVLSEQARYSLIATTIYESISRNECSCYAFQECEFSIYKSIVKRLDKSRYVCRFIPHRIAYDEHGLYIESYGCALIIKVNPLANGQEQTFVNPIQKVDHCKRESKYKYIVVVSDNVLYSSVHFPRYGKQENYSAWVNYAYQDIDFMLSKLNERVSGGYLIGDFNMREAVLQQFLGTFTGYTFMIMANRGVDYIIHVTKDYSSMNNFVY